MKPKLNRKQLEEYLANLSHEIRTPLHAILGMTEALSETDLTPTQRQYLEVLQNSGRHLLGVTDGFFRSLDEPSPPSPDVSRSAMPVCPPTTDRKWKILVVEDEVVNQTIARLNLSKLGYEYAVAGNGKLAIEALESGNFDLILMDCLMPEMDGYEATRKIRAAGKSLPIVALTANALANNERLCLEAGMNAYLTKPVRREELDRMIREQLRPAAAAPSVTARGIDPAAIENLAAFEEPGAEDIVETILKTFLSSTEQSLTRLRETIANRSLDGTMLIAHALKSAAANVGATDLSVSSRRLEELCRSGRLEGAEALVETLRAELNRIRPELEEIIRTRSRPNKAAA